jgi:hypothetical protein
MGKIRKRWFSLVAGGLEVEVKPSWHPAYELRATQMRKFSVNHEMLADWQEIAAKVPEVCQ